MKHGLLILCCALSAFLAGPPASAAARSATAAEPPTDCIHRAITFDGITRLTYAIVKSDATGRAALHHDYPQACNVGDNWEWQCFWFILPRGHKLRNSVTIIFAV
jgi:hypothetical protein